MGPNSERDAVSEAQVHELSQLETIDTNIVRKEMDDHDGDEALQAILLEHGHRAVIDEATNRRLRRRIDLCLMPLMGFTYLMQYLDKVYRILFSLFILC